MNNDLVCFDLFETPDIPELKNIIFLTIYDLIHTQLAKYPNRRKVIVFDEAWALMKSKEGKEFMEELFRTMRKYNCMVIAISQRLEDFSNEEMSSALVQNAPQKIVLKCEAPEIASIAKIMKLNSAETNIIRTLRTRPGEFSEFFVSLSGIGSGKLRSRPCPEEYWLNTTNKDDSIIFDQYMNQFNGSIENTISALAQKFPHGNFTFKSK